MSNFSVFEYSVLSAIFVEQPKLMYGLIRQVWAAEIADRESAGAGFYTAIDVPDALALYGLPILMGNSILAHVVGMAHPLGFNLFTKGGRLCLLETFSLQDEDTAGLLCENVRFRITKSDRARSDFKPLGIAPAPAIDELAVIGRAPLAAGAPLIGLEGHLVQGKPGADRVMDSIAV